MSTICHSPFSFYEIPHHHLKGEYLYLLVCNSYLYSEYTVFFLLFL